MKNYLGKNILKCLLTLLIGAVLGTVLLILAFLIPIDEDKARESFDIIVTEDSYAAVPVLGDFSGMSLQSYKPGVLDGSSDEIMIFTALDFFSEDHNALTRSMNMYNGYMGINYAYYWHGYVIILRPLLNMISLADLRFINGLLQMFLIFALAKKIWQKKGKIYCVVMFTSYILLMPIALMFSLQFTWVFYIGILSAYLLICKSEWAEEKQRYIVIFFVIGMLTSYFDMLTYPLFTWGIPLLWWLMVRDSDQGRRKWLTEVIASGISWVLGYGIFWGLKWCLGTIILKENIIESAFNEIFLRSGMEESLSLSGRFQAVYTNWKHYEYLIYALILLVWLVWGIVRGFRKGWYTGNKVYSYLLIGVSSAVWYFVLANHTFEHHFFTYRILNVSILAFLAIWVESFDRAGTGYEIVQKKMLFKIAAFLLIGIASVGCAFLARDDVWATNGYASYHSVPISTEDVLSVNFHPTFPRIKEFGICVKPQKEEGMIEITLLDGEDTVEQDYYSLEGWGAEAYHTIPVDWKLSANKDYVMQLRLIDNDKTADVLVTDPEEMLLGEYGVLQLNGEDIAGQIIAGIIYWHYPTSRKMQLFLTLTWVGILSCAALALFDLYEFLRKRRVNS